MKIINLDSKYVPTQAQLTFAENVIEFGEHEPMRSEDSLAVLANEIPIFLVSTNGMERFEGSDLWGFYCHKFPVGTSRIPAIGLCLERMIESCKNEEELTILFAKVLIHELAHAKMTTHPRAQYGPPDEFYEWMEEPMANLIVLEAFRDFERGYRRSYWRRHEVSPFSMLNSPMSQVRRFIEMQPDNYRLGLDFFDSRLRYWWIWRNNKDDIRSKSAEKQAWLDYVQANVGRASEDELDRLFEALHR